MTNKNADQIKTWQERMQPVDHGDNVKSRDGAMVDEIADLRVALQAIDAPAVPFAYFHRDPSKNPEYQQVMPGAAGQPGIVAAYTQPVSAAVPEPTQKMIEAGARAAREYFDDSTGGNSPAVIYRAMLAAAPRPVSAKPLTEIELSDLMPVNTNMTRPEQLRWMARAVERAHGITGAPS